MLSRLRLHFNFDRMIAASRLTSSKEKAQDYIVTAAGLLVGSSVLNLTVLWAICFICGRTKFCIKPSSTVRNQAVQLLTGLHSSLFFTIIMY